MKSHLRDLVLSSFLALENNLDTHSEFHKLRTEALQEFKKTGIPKKKEPLWEYTSLNRLTSKDYTLFPQKKDLKYQNLEPYFIDNTETHKIVFINGIYNSFLSETTHDNGLDICLLSSAIHKEVYHPILYQYFGQSATSNGLVNLNTAFAQEGAYIYVPKNRVVDKPVQIIFFSTSEKDLFTQPRNLIILEEGADIQIIEKHHNLGSNFTFTNSVTEVFVDKKAKIDYYKIQNDTENSALVDNSFFKQSKQSEVCVHTSSFGGQLVRNNLDVSQNGIEANTKLNGITILKNKQHVDHNTHIHHRSPNCESFEEYRALIDDSATGIFNGRITVDKEAQKLNAYQQNRNVLVGDKATAYAKPQLEIFADDVRCSHGCTIGQIDQDMLFYLQSRGIPKKQAEGLLMFAFANSVLNEIKIPEIKEHIKNLISEKFSVKLAFDL